MSGDLHSGWTPRTFAVVQARFTSVRLPGKVLRPLRGRPMLAYLLEALSHARMLDGVVLATSTDTTDDAIADFAREARVDCYRGPLDDVAARLLAAAESRGADALVRVNGDSPLLDPALVDLAVDLFRRAQPDVVTNVRPRSYPKGQSVEVMSCAALSRAVAEMATPDEREHVTRHFYENPDRFTIRSFTTPRPRPDLQLSVDDAADFERCEAVLDVLGRSPWEAGWEACAEAYESASRIS
jgi:spore coat polysaccharide biosynthesis protein SpsF (cytidylyltransferase family)